MNFLSFKFLTALMVSAALLLPAFAESKNGDKTSGVKKAASAPKEAAISDVTLSRVMKLLEGEKSIHQYMDKSFAELDKLFLRPKYAKFKSRYAGEGYKKTLRDLAVKNVSTSFRKELTESDGQVIIKTLSDPKQSKSLLKLIDFNNTVVTSCNNVMNAIMVKMQNEASGSK